MKVCVFVIITIAWTELALLLLLLLYRVCFNLTKMWPNVINFPDVSADGSWKQAS